MQWFRILMITGLAGLFGFGLTFLTWDLAAKCAQMFSESRRHKRAEAAEEALQEGGQSERQKGA